MRSKCASRQISGRVKFSTDNPQKTSREKNKDKTRQDQKKKKKTQDQNIP
jgi:hypothetical protein